MKCFFLIIPPNDKNSLFDDSPPISDTFSDLCDLTETDKWRFVWICNFVIREAVFLLSFTSFLAKASCKTLTNGPLSERKTTCFPTSILCLSFAILSHARVFPEPGTPVIKHIDYGNWIEGGLRPAQDAASAWTRRRFPDHSLENPVEVKHRETSRFRNLFQREISVQIPADKVHGLANPLSVIHCGAPHYITSSFPVTGSKYNGGNRPSPYTEEQIKRAIPRPALHWKYLNLDLANPGPLYDPFRNKQLKHKNCYR